MTEIEHEARIVKIEPAKITVEIENAEACAGCSAKNICNNAQCREKQVEIPVYNAEPYSLDQKINVVMSEENGFRAVVFAYLIPLLLLLGVLFGGVYAGMSEIKAGILSVIVLIPYYFILFLSRKYFAAKIHFTIKADDN